MRLRPPVPPDAPAVLQLLIERDTFYLGAPETTLGDLNEWWHASAFDLGADARVVEAAGQILAYAATSKRGTMVVVAPEQEGRGLGTCLLRWAETRNRARGARSHLQWVPSRNHRAQALLAAAGFRYQRSYWRMGRAVAGDDLVASLPPGVRLRPVEIDQDAESLHDLDEVSFKANADYRPSSLAEFREEQLLAHDFDPELSCVAESLGQPIGFVLTRRWPDETVGFIALFGVHPEHRRRGLGTAMLQAAFARFASAGLREAQLGVASDNPTAFRLYERVGMTERLRWDIYERRVDSPASRCLSVRKVIE